MLEYGQGDAWALPLLFGAGLLSSLAPQVREALSQMLPENTNIMGVAVISGVVLGAVQALIWPPLLQSAARLLGGVGRLRGSRLAAGWSSLPVLVSYLLAPLGVSDDALVAAFGVVSFFLSVWTIYLLVHSLAAAQRLSASRALLSVVLGAVLTAAALLAVGFAAALVLTLLGVTPQSFPGTGL